MSHDPNMQSSSPSAADANIERLLTEAYKPELPDAEFLKQVKERMLAATAPAPYRLAWGRVVLAGLAAAAAIIVVVGLIMNLGNQPKGARRLAGNVQREEASGTKASPGPQGTLGLTARPRGSVPVAPAVGIGDSIQTKAGERRRVMLPDGSIAYVNQNTLAKVEGSRRITLTSGEIFLEVMPREAGSSGEPTFVVETPNRRITALGTKFDVRVEAAGTGVLVTQGKVRVSGVDDPLVSGQQLSPQKDNAKPAVEPAPRASQALDWTRDLVAAAQSPLVPDSEYQGGALIVVDPYGQQGRLSLRNYHIDVHIEDGFARTTIDQTYFNHENRRQEGTFYFPLPADASLSRLAMYVDGKLMEGGMAERDYARSVYEQILYTQRDPALLEWMDGSTFKMRVFPLEPRQEKRIIISYIQKLPEAYGQAEFRFPAGHNLELVRDWSFHAAIKNGSNLHWSSDTHELAASYVGGDLVLDAAAKHIKPDRDVVVRLYRSLERTSLAEPARFSSVTHQGSRYLMVRYRPELPRDARKERRDWLFLFEASGNRDPLLARVQVDVIKTILENAEHDDTFNILIASTRTSAYSDKPLLTTPRNIKDAIAYLEKTHLVGALDLEKALTSAESMLKGAGNPYLVHVGAAVAALGERREDVLAKRIPAGVRYVGVGVGKQWSRAFMKGAASRTGGYVTQINPDQQVTWRAFDLLATLNAPRLLDLKVVDSTGQLAFLTFTDSLVHGEELAAVARIDPNGGDPAAVVVTGTVNGQAYQQAIAVTNPAPEAGYLPRAWAKLEIDRLLAENAEGNKQNIIALSKASYVMSPYTSLLVLENEAMYEQFKVDRGRKDHWAMYPAPEKIAVVYEPDPAGANGRTPAATEGKLPAEQVLQTVLIRVPVPIYRWPDEQGYYSGQTISVLQAYSAPPSALNTEILVRRGDSLRGWGEIDLGGISGGSFFFDSSGGMNQWAFRNGLMDSNSAARGGMPMAGPVPMGSVRLMESDSRFAGSGRDLFRHYYGVTSYGTFAPTSGGFGGAGGRHGGFAGSALIAAKPGLSLEYKYKRLEQPLDRLRGIDLDLKGRFSVDAAKSISRGKESFLSGSARRRLVDTRKAEESLFLIGGALRYPAGYRSRNLMYQQAYFSGDWRLFSNLLQYAPGMNTMEPDVSAVLEAEAIADPAQAPGRIDPRAKQLIDRARGTGWQSVTIRPGHRQPEFAITLDGKGRYAYQRIVSDGLREQVYCDGTTLWHLYPDLGVGAKRQVSRFHRAAFAEWVPWALPAAEDLAHGCDLVMADDHTIAVVPRTPTTRPTTQPTSAQVQLVFASDGRLAERRLVETPSGKVLYWQTYSAAGVVQAFDEKNAEVEKQDLVRKDAQAVEVTPEVKELVILPLPLRSREYVLQSRHLDAGTPAKWSNEDALAYIGTDLSQQGHEMLRVVGERFFRNGDRREGFYTMLLSMSHAWDPHAAQGMGDGAQVSFDPLADHPQSTLARYVVDELRFMRQGNNAELKSPAGEERDFVNRMAGLRYLWATYSSGRANQGNEAQQRQHRQFALDFIRTCRDPHIGWGVFALVRNYGGNTDFYGSLAEAVQAFQDVEGLGYAARYEYASNLSNSGKQQEAMGLFAELYRQTLGKGMLPPIDYQFRNAFQRDNGGQEQWSKLMREASAALMAEHGRAAGVYLAWQCHQVGDQPLAEELFTSAMMNLPEAERLMVTLIGIDYLQNTGQYPRADALMEPLLGDTESGKYPELWRLGSVIAGNRGMMAKAVSRLERAMDLEYQDLPAVVNLQEVRSGYGQLLGQYQQLADALATLEQEPPRDLIGKVIRYADRWRALDSEGTAACQAAARILERFGQKELAWDYLTTPLANRPNEASAWQSLAGTLRQQGDWELADRAYVTAFEVEPTNAQILWDRAQLLQQIQRVEEARKLYRQLAEGTWQPRFAGIQRQARGYVRGE